MASGLRFSTVNAGVDLPIGVTLRCPLCRKQITGLGALQADLAEEPAASDLQPVTVTDGKMLGWAASCGCLISASIFTLEIRFRTNPSGEQEVTSVAFTRNPVYRDPAVPGKPATREREIPPGTLIPPLIG
jgi:hypothetical protein